MSCLPSAYRGFAIVLRSPCQASARIRLTVATPEAIIAIARIAAFEFLADIVMPILYLPSKTGVVVQDRPLVCQSLLLLDRLHEQYSTRSPVDCQGERGG